MKRFFVVYAEGETTERFQEEIDRLLDEGFDFQGLPFANNGKLYQGMRKNTPDSITTATEPTGSIRKEKCRINHRQLVMKEQMVKRNSILQKFKQDLFRSIFFPGY